jgi:hypothetical protein
MTEVTTPPAERKFPAYVPHPLSPVLTRLALFAAVLMGGAAFLYMVKLMHDMTFHISQMTTDISAMSANMGKMQTDMASLARDVGDMRQQVASLPGIAADMQQMRVTLGRMSGLFGGGETLRQANPVEMMQQLVPGADRR